MTSVSDFGISRDISEVPILIVQIIWRNEKQKQKQKPTFDYDNYIRCMRVAYHT